MARPLARSHRRAEGATETDRPARVGSAAHGVACSSPVGTMTTGREPEDGAMGAINSRSRRSAARASCSSAPAPRADVRPAVGQAAQGQRTWPSSLRTSAPEATLPVMAPPVGHDDGVQLAVDLGELDECGGASAANKSASLACRRGAPRHLFTPGSALPRPFPGPTLEVGLAGQQGAGSSPLVAQAAMSWASPRSSASWAARTSSRGGRAGDGRRLLARWRSIHCQMQLARRVSRARRSPVPGRVLGVDRRHGP